MLNGPMPPPPTHSALTAYAIILPLLAVALLTSPIWMGAFGVLKLMQRVPNELVTTLGRLVQSKMPAPRWGALARR